MRLGELLLQQKKITPEGLEEALESQVVNGGRLGTNLCELGLIQEADLARALGQQHNVAFASGEMIPDQRALEMVDLQFADDKDVLPMRLDPTRIFVAVINPHDYGALDAIGFKTGRRVVPVVIPEFRMNQLLRRHCRAFRLIRPIDMNTIRPSKTLGTLQDGPKPVEAADLINEEQFQNLYAQAMVGGPEPAAQDAIPAADISFEEPPPVTVAAQRVRPPPAPAPQVVPTAEIDFEEPPPAPAPKVVPAAEIDFEEPQPLPAALPVPPPPPAPAPRKPQLQEIPAVPLSFAEAQQELSHSNVREDVARTVLRFALGKWKRALLLSVQGDLVTGWQGVGQGIRAQAIQRIGIGVRGGQSTFKLVRDSRSHYIGPVKRDAGTAVFYKLLGGGYPTTAVLLPLLVRGKVVHILYVDNGPDQLTPPDIGELLILSQSVGRSYEAMIRRRKSA
jgi:hypothetical protein